MNYTNAKLQELIIVNETIGSNTDADPYRTVKKIFDKDGNLMGKLDGMYSFTQEELISFATYVLGEETRHHSSLPEHFAEWEADRKRGIH